MRQILPTAVTLALLAGCGGDDRSSEAAATPTPTPTSTPMPAKTPDAADAPARVRIEGFDYAPANVRVAAAATVRWTNQDKSNHTVTFKKGPGDLGNVDPGRKLSATFEKSGTYPYICAYHPGMRGSVTVE